MLPSGSNKISTDDDFDGDGRKNSIAGKIIIGLLVIGVFVYVLFLSEKKEVIAKEKEEITVCDCLMEEKDMREEMQDANGDQVKIMEIQQKYEPVKKACQKLGEGKSEEELKKLMVEAEKCPGGL